MGAFQICRMLRFAFGDPFGWAVKNAASLQKKIVHISLNRYFLEAPLVARISSKFFPYLLINIWRTYLSTKGSDRK